jgi:peptide/nickel transport system substrate-binding protein
MLDKRRQAGLLDVILRTGWLDRRALLRAAGTLGLAGPFATAACNTSAAAQDAGGALISSRPREAVMQEILAEYPLRREGAPDGGTVVLATVGDLASFNPLLESNAGPLLGLVYEGLVGVHPVDGAIVPGLADYELAADGVTYTFRIHPDARFHDGAPVTAADAEFSLATILDPAFNSPIASSVRDVLKSYRAVDDRTFEMVSVEPIASFLYDAPPPVMPKHVWAEVAPADWPSDPGSTGEDPARVVGSGPFRFVEWIQGEHTTLARNDDYWDRALGRVPYLDEIVFRVLPDVPTTVLALKAGDVDVADLPPEEIDQLATADGLAVVRYEGLNFVFYAYQLDPGETPLFQDRAVREALFVALDRHAIVDQILAGEGEVASGTHAPLSPAYAPDEFEPYAYDPGRARDLLAQAGWTDADGDGVVEKEGQRLSFTMLSPGESATATLVDAYMQDAWNEVGVEMTPEPLPFPILLDRIDARDFEMARLGFAWNVDPGQGLMFETEAAFNFFGYSNPEYDRLEIEQRRTLDPARRIDLILEQAKIVWEDLPVGILAFRTLGVGHNARLQSFFPNAYSYYWSAPFWYLEG